MIKARALYHSNQRLLVAQGASLHSKPHEHQSWQHWSVLPIDPFRRLAMRIPALARLLRLGVHHLVLSDGGAIVLTNKESYLINNGKAVFLGSLQGSRPMALCSGNGAVYYGEYRSNPERSAVHVFKLDHEPMCWVPAWRFDGVRHVHGVFFDPYTEAFWVTTGDSDEESAIWRTDDQFQTLQKVVGGSQQFRAVQLLFSSTHVYFGSDAPDEPNYLYRMDRSGTDVERLQAVGGSVFYGAKVGDSLFFSTAVEPSSVNTGQYAELWGSADGAAWQKIDSFRKDRLSMKYFQYGQVLFPNGEGDGKTLYITPFGTRYHGCTLAYPLAELFQQN